MYGSSQGSPRSGPGRGPALYYGYCGRSGRYRMMDLPEYMSNVQEGMSRWMNDGANAYQDMLRGYSDMAQGAYGRASKGGDCGCGKQRDCNDCHCECCVCDADVLVHARCGEIRRIPITFENDTRREKPVKLELGKFLSAGGRDLGWPAELSETEFTLRPCGEQNVSLIVAIRCGDDDKIEVRPGQPPAQPVEPVEPNPNNPNQPPAGPNALGDRDAIRLIAPISRLRGGSVDRCEVGYATIRAEGCLTRPIVVAVAVLPDDCDAYRHPCGCGCCH